MASLPLPAPSTICRDESGGQIARLYGRGLHRAIPNCHPGRVGSGAWPWLQQGPVYRHVCILSIKPLLLSCLAHDFTFHSTLSSRASAGLATDGHSRASNLMLLLWTEFSSNLPMFLWVLKKATSPPNTLCFSLK